MRVATKYFLIILISLQVKGQVNIVPNGSFEEFNWCPNNEDGFYINSCKFWNMPTLGTSDYFNACSQELDSEFNTPLFSVPHNYIGHQNARSGNAYAGFLFSSDQNLNSPSDYSEYIQVKLNQQLIENKYYKLQFYANVSFQSCANSIGALFTSEELFLNTDDVILLPNQFQSDLNYFLCDSSKWHEVNFLFQANGEENYLTIGVFTPFPLTQFKPNFGENAADVYYFVDDVSLIEVDFEAIIKDQIPNVFTPNNDGVNDFFIFDNGIVNAQKITILNRWGNVVYFSENEFAWNGKFKDEYCSDGMYYYVIENKFDFKISGYFTLLK
jgi:gliding motility-associated-like protein